MFLRINLYNMLWFVCKEEYCSLVAEALHCFDCFEFADVCTFQQLNWITQIGLSIVFVTVSGVNVPVAES